MITLYEGDCLIEMDRIADGSVDAIIADLPYGTTACKWDTVIPFEPLWAQYKRINKPRGAIVLFGSQPFTSALVMSNLEWFKYVWVWEKSRATGFLDAEVRPLNNIEDIVVFGSQFPEYNPQMTIGKAHKRGCNGRAKKAESYADFDDSQTESYLYYPTRTLRFQVCAQQMHPNQKPLALLEYLVRTYTSEGDTVLDNVMGSGTTGVACINTGRNFIGIEKDAKYFATAKARIEKALRTPAQLGFDSLEHPDSEREPVPAEALQDA